MAEGRRRKQPLTRHGVRDATIESARIEAWWRRWPTALIGGAAGHWSVVLDIDVKRPDASGFDTLCELGFGVLPETPMVHTPSGGLHLHFAPRAALRSTVGAAGAGIGPGLDWRGAGGYTILPSPGSGYSWDPVLNLETTRLAPVPEALSPREPARPVIGAEVPRSNGLSRYAEAALEGACRAIASATAGEQEVTLHRECFSIGQLAGSGAVPERFALRVLHCVASGIPTYDSRRPWSAAELARKVDRSFRAGLAHPRSVPR
jgi:putative DNA primase/helicase